MPNFVVNHNRRRASVETARNLWRQLIVSILLMWTATLVAMFTAVTDFIDSYCPRFLKWRRTSVKELEDVDNKILGSLPCVREKKYVPVGENDKLWSVICNPDKGGTPLVMVHGMGGGVGLWSMNLEALAEKRPVFAFDLLGFGRSSRPSFSEDPQEAEDLFVESIENYRKSMGLDKFILLGHSLGGFLSASYTLRYPQHVKHLILVDPWGMSKRPTEGRRNIPLVFRAILSIVNMGYPLSALRVLGPLGPRLVKRYRPGLAQTFASRLGDEELLHNYIYHCNAQKPSGEVGFKSMMWQLGWAKNPMIPRMVDIDPDVPITFVFGAQSWVDRATGWKFKSSHPGYVDVQILRGAGHHVYADRWDLFNSLIQSIACCVDRGELPNLDRKLVQRIHASPSVQTFQVPDPEDPDFERPVGHGDENVMEPETEGEDTAGVRHRGKHSGMTKAGTAV